MIRGVGKLPKAVVEIVPTDEKHVINKKNWMTVDAYVKKHVYDRLTTEEIQNEVNRAETALRYDKFSFLADDKDFSFFKTEKRSRKINDEVGDIIKYLVHQGKFSAKVPNIYKKYPLLERIGYVYKEHQAAIIQYVNLINLYHNEKENSTNVKAKSEGCCAAVA
jgi:hypothetical protein